MPPVQLRSSQSNSSALKRLVPRVDKTKANHPAPTAVILFDGVCNLCNGFVNWVIDRDPGARFGFLALQSPAGRELAARAGLDPDVLGTLVVIDSGRVRLRSEGVLWVGRRLQSRLAPIARVCSFVPRPVCDLGYRLVARLRYRLFGRQESCRVPTPELMRHFLDPNDGPAALRAAGLPPGPGLVA